MPCAHGLVITLQSVRVFPERLTSDNMGLTVDSGGDYHVKDLGAVAGVDQLVGAERVVAQRTAARLVLCFYYDHNVETVAGEVFSLDDGERREKA